MDDPILAVPKDTALVVKHNKLIEAKYRLTLQEKRILLWLMSEIQAGDKDFKRYRVRIADLAHFVGISNDGGRLYREIAAVTGRLRKREIDINDMDRNVTIQATWIASAEYRWNEGVVDICLSPALMPYLLDLKSNFTKISLRYAMGLKSVHAIRIYELLKQYEGLGERTIKVADLRAFCGIAPDDYKFFKDFRVWVVDVARREVNGKTDMAFAYTPIKEGRKVVSLRFTISRNQRAAKPDDLRDDPALARLVSRLVAHGIAEEKARTYVRDKPPELIEWATEDLARRLKAR